MSISDRLKYDIPDSDTQEPWLDAFSDLVNEIDASVYSVRENLSILVSGGGIFGLSGNVLTWSGDIHLSAALTGKIWTVATGQVGLQDGEYLYVTLNRAPIDDTTVTTSVGTVVPNTNDVFVLAQRRSNQMYFANGAVLTDGAPTEVLDGNYIYISGGSVFNDQTGTTYTLTLLDRGKTITLGAAGATTVTVPTNAAVAFPIGTHIEFIQIGAGKVTFAGAGGVTVSSEAGHLAIAAQYVKVTLIKHATNTWYLCGELIA